MSAQTISFPQLSSEFIKQAFFDGFPGIMWIKDQHGVVIWVSDNYEEQCGIPAAAVLQHTASEIFCSEIGSELEELDQRARKTGRTTMEDVAVPCGHRLVWRRWVTPLSGGRVLCSALPIA